jgi:hypothetical protein
MVINDKIAFIPIPKNASWSVEDTCVKYKLDLKYTDALWENSIRMDIKVPERHIHSTIDQLLDKFGDNLEYVSIVRNSTDRFISAWKYFISSMEYELNNEVLSNKIKNFDNSFVMEFIKENYSKLPSCYNLKSLNEDLLIILLKKMEIYEYLNITDRFKKQYRTHIWSFLSQYRWILNDRVKVKQFHFDRLNEFEDYISNQLGIDFKLIHQNKTILDYCAVTKTDELVSFVDTYIDGMYKRNKSLI